MQKAFSLLIASAAAALFCTNAEAADTASAPKLAYAADSSATIEIAGDAAFEQEDEEPGWSFEATSGFVSDYRYRGVSLSDRNPALQLDATVAAPNGLYAYGWASQIADNGGENIELMGALGWSGAFFSEDLSLDISGGLYAYPGVSDASIVEFAATFTRTYGDIEVTSGVSYMPEQATLGDLADTYLTFGVGAPLFDTGATGSLGLGWEDGAFGDGKVDWIAAVDTPVFEDFTLRFAYAGAARHAYGMAGEDTFVLEIRYGFSA